MALKRFCDRCNREIDGSLSRGEWRGSTFGEVRLNKPDTGISTVVKELCAACMRHIEQEMDPLPTVRGRD